MWHSFRIPISWGELAKRTTKEMFEDNALGLAAQLAYYLLLALVPALVFLVSLISLFPIRVLDGMLDTLQTVAPGEMTEIVRTQLQSIRQGEPAGLLTFGFVFALWSSSAATVAATNALNRAYDIEEGRPWWRVRLEAIALTVALALFTILAFALVLGGPAAAEWLAAQTAMGGVFEWTWKILQWPLVIALMSVALGMVYYFGPDADQDWEWITPGALLGTVLWLIASLAFKVYVANFGNYNETYGTLGGIIVLMLWFYISALAVLAGAEMNAEIEHASPYGKNPGEKVPGEKKKLGARAERSYREQQDKQKGQPAPMAHPATPAARPRHFEPQVSHARWSEGRLFQGLALFLATRVFRRKDTRS